MSNGYGIRHPCFSHLVSDKWYRRTTALPSEMFCGSCCTLGILQSPVQNLGFTLPITGDALIVQ